MADEELLRASQAAAYLGVTTQHIYGLAAAGTIGRRIGGYWLFTRAELEAYAAQPKSKGGRPKTPRKPAQKRPRKRPEY